MIKIILFFWAALMSVILLGEFFKYFRQENKETKKLLFNLFRIIAYLVIGSAIIILVYLLVMKFVFNQDLISGIFYQ